MEQMRERVADTYEKPAHGWTCFHCGETFKTIGAARNHFGFTPEADPACRIKLGAERGLVAALRKAEKELDEAWAAIHSESTEAAKAYHAQNSRHREQLFSVEEAGYEKGLADGRAEIDRRVAEEKAKLMERLREPSEAMLDVGAETMPDYDPSYQDAMNVWQAMLAQYEKDNSHAPNN